MPTQCGNGQCNTASNQCVCNNCWMPDGTGACNVQQTCSGNGICNPADSKCYCNNKCISGLTCATVETCNNHGNCDTNTGSCNCFPGFGNKTKCAECDGCHQDPTNGCSVITDHCGMHGTCAVYPDGTKKGCNCDAGWLGVSCTTQASDNSGNGNGGLVGAAVGVPMSLIGAAAIGIFFFARSSGLSFGQAAIKAPAALVAQLSSSGKKYVKVGGVDIETSGLQANKGKGTGASAPKSAYAISSSSGVGSSQAASRLSSLAKPTDGASKKSGLLSTSSSSSSSKGGGYGGLGGSYQSGGGGYGSSTAGSYNNL